MTDFLQNPPWKVMPNIDPVSAPWKQGDLELYMNEWLGFWEKLSLTERQDYFLKTNAPEAWKDYLEFIFTQD
jgi:hypothetical protein